MNGWWRSLQFREQLALQTGAALLVAVSLFLITEPLLQERAMLRETVPQLRADLQWMQQSAQRIKGGAQPRVAHADVPGDPGTMHALLRNAGLADQVAALSERGRGHIEVQFDSAEHARLISWLHALEMRGGFVVESLNVTAIEAQPGRVTARVLLAGAKPTP